MSTPAIERPTLDLEGLQASDTPKEEFGVPDSTRTRETAHEKVRKIAGLKNERTQTARKATPKKPAPRAKKGQFVEPLTALYGGMAAMLNPFDEQCAAVIAASAVACAESLDELAYQNDAVRKALTALTQTSAVGAVLFAHAPIIMAVAAHHGPGIKFPPFAGKSENNSGEPDGE